jgi:hypothetical protein
MNAKGVEAEPARLVQIDSTGNTNVKQPVICCPCCKTEFRCGAATVPFTCDCQNLRLTTDAQASIRERFGATCLCPACLRKIQSAGAE